MKVLCVNHYPVFGGPHNQFLRLNIPLEKRGWQSVVVLPQEPGTAAERLRNGGVEVVQLPLHRLRKSLDLRLHIQLLAGLIPEVCRLRQLIRERKIDLVLVAGLVHPHAAFAAHLEGIPIVWQIVDSSTPALLKSVTMPLVASLANSVMFDGEHLVSLHVGSRRLGGKAIVYYPPVEVSRFRPSAGYRRATRNELGIPEDAMMVGTVANINPLKGIEYFVRAASIIHRLHPNTRFVIVGARHETHKKYNTLIDEEIRRSQVPPEHFIFTGSRPDVEKYYPAMDVKLITSITEGTTTTAMEAMSCGVPVVTTDVGAVREVVENGVTGLVVPPLDPEAIAQATMRLLQEPNLRVAFGKAGRSRAIERFDVEICAGTHACAFDAALTNFQERHKQHNS